ncbi:hypothetical protein E0H80_11655 [Acinetobacter sp. ANC 4779]|uniref:putative pilus system protein FilF n=1 Tax=Acinetobacter sp. ANC 4779 TaxID=2529848 RepID=UPI00103F23FB|nr:hypothetical protein [Acinetobacter sp. ANC 4779]TCB49639.1 hypothetical protein E0H80_11655 [Acinetobacter sp. ANC 4779]
MNINKYKLPFVATALVMILTGCGGESANVTAEVYDESTANGACKVGTAGCIEFAFDYPLNGLNFTCSSDTKNRFTTLFDPSGGVATGACKNTDDITFFLRGEKDKKIELGTIPLRNIAIVSVAQLPRLTLLDIAAGIQGRAAQRLSLGDATVKVAIRLVRLIQAAGLQNQQIVNARDIQPVSISDADRKKLEQITSLITTEQFKGLSDKDFADAVKPWVDISQVTDEDAFAVITQLMRITTAAVYQPEFSLFSSAEVLGSTLSGSEGLVGCNQQECKAEETSATHLLGHFILMTDRQGKSFGSGLQWRGKAGSGLTTIGGVNAQLIRTVKPVQMTASAQDTWIHPITRAINNNPDLTTQSGFLFNVTDVNSQPLTITQGKLFNDYMVAGKERFYKLLTGKKEVNEEDKKNYGLWQQQVNGETFRGTLDLYKIYPITYLDSKVFKSENNVSSGTYIFPLYADLVFKFTDTTVNTVKLGIVIDRNGDIRTNMKDTPAPATDSSGTFTDMSTGTNGCSGTDVLASDMIDSNNVQQYRIGTTGRAFTSSGMDGNKISIRMILADKVFQSLDGALIGMNSSIKTSPNSSESIVIGGALLNLNRLLAMRSGGKPAVNDVPLKDSADNIVKWANSFASFQSIYSTVDPADQDAKQWSKYSGGSIQFNLAPCYEVKTK